MEVFLGSTMTTKFLGSNAIQLYEALNYFHFTHTMTAWPLSFFFFYFSLSSFWSQVVLEITPPSPPNKKKNIKGKKYSLIHITAYLSKKRKKKSLLVDFVISSILSHFVQTSLLMLAPTFGEKVFSWIFLVFYWLALYIC